MSMQKQAAAVYEIANVAYTDWMKQRPYDRIVRLHVKRNKRKGHAMHPQPRLSITGRGNRRTKKRVR